MCVLSFRTSRVQGPERDGREKWGHARVGCRAQALVRVLLNETREIAKWELIVHTAVVQRQRCKVLSLVPGAGYEI